MAWQKATGYGRRSLVETATGNSQQGEVAIAVQALNRMIRIAKPISACLI